MDGISFRSGTADLEMFEMNKAGKSSDKSWDIRSGVEERWILMGQEFCDVLVAVLCLMRVGSICLRRVCEVDLLSSFRMNQRRQRTLSVMWNAECQVLYMMSQAIQSGKPGGPC